MKRDLLLCFFEADPYRARWTETIQQEWLQNAKEKYPGFSEKMSRTDELMRNYFGDAWVEGYEHFIDLVELQDDPDDRHVVAAAIKCKAQYVVTDNLKHFPEDVLSEFDLERGTADKFLASTFEHYPHQALQVIRDHRSGLNSAPSESEYLMMLVAKGLPLLSSRIKPHRNAI